MRFKAGDKVKCIDGDGSDNALKTGEVYIIERRHQSGNVQLVGVPNHYWWASRFELAADAPPVPASSPRRTTLPVDSNERKDVPMLRGCLRYFPAALAGVARTSKLGNDKHNPGEEMHHARAKSTDQGDCIIRHLMDTEDLLAALARGNTDVTPESILLEVNQLAWRALAFSQEVHEKFGAPLAPGAKVETNKKEN